MGGGALQAKTPLMAGAEPLLEGWGHSRLQIPMEALQVLFLIQAVRGAGRA